MMSNDWNVVGKSGKSKKSSKVPKQTKKQVEQKFVARYSDSDEEIVKFARNGAPGAIDFKGNLTKPTNKKQQQSNQVKKSIRKSYNQILKDIDVSELKQYHEKTKAEYPDSPSSVLFFLAMFLNRKFDAEHEKETLVVSHIRDFPSSEVNPKSLKFINGIISQTGKPNLSQFLVNSMNNMIVAYDKGSCSIGFKLLIQICFMHLHTMPDSVGKMIAENLHQNQQQTGKFKILVWILTQAANAEFSVGCSLWLNMLMKYLPNKQLSEHIMTFGEQLFTNAPTPSASSGYALHYQEFISFLDLAFTNETAGIKKGGSLNPTVQKYNNRLRCLYIKLKNHAFLNKSPKELQDYFPSLLVRITSVQSKLQKELLDCLSFCLFNAPYCYNIWSSIHGSHPLATNVLLKHLFTVYGTDCMLKPGRGAVMQFIQVVKKGSPDSKLAVENIDIAEAMGRQASQKSWFRKFWAGIKWIILLSIFAITMAKVCSAANLEDWPVLKRYQDLINPYLQHFVKLLNAYCDEVYKYSGQYGEIVVTKITAAKEMLRPYWNQTTAYCLQFYREYCDPKLRNGFKAVSRIYVQHVEPSMSKFTSEWLVPRLEKYTNIIVEYYSIGMVWLVDISGKLFQQTKEYLEWIDWASYYDGCRQVANQLYTRGHTSLTELWGWSSSRILSQPISN